MDSMQYFTQEDMFQYSGNKFSRMEYSSAWRLLNCIRNELQYIQDNWHSVLVTATAIPYSWGINSSFSS